VTCGETALFVCRLWVHKDLADFLLFAWLPLMMTTFLFCLREVKRSPGAWLKIRNPKVLKSATMACSSDSSILTSRQLIVLHSVKYFPRGFRISVTRDTSDTNKSGPLQTRKHSTGKLLIAYTMQKAETSISVASKKGETLRNRNWGKFADACGFRFRPHSASPPHPIIPSSP
jgi:hypothetical protein